MVEPVVIIVGLIHHTAYVYMFKVYPLYVVVLLASQAL